MKKIFKALAVTAASTALCAGIATATACSAGTNGTYVGEYHYIGAHSPAPYGMVVEVTVENNIITGIKDITNTDAAKSYQTYKDVVDGKVAEEESYHAFTVVSPGWESYFDANVHANYVWLLYHGYDLGEGYEAAALYYQDVNPKGELIKNSYTKWDIEKWDNGDEVLPSPAQTNVHSYGWTDANSNNWSSHESWLLSQYVGWSVADILAINVYTNFGYALATGADGKTTQVLDTSSMGEPYGTDYNGDLKGSELLITGATQGSGRLLLAVQNALKNK